MTSSSPAGQAHPYLRAASAGLRHHHRALARNGPAPAADRVHLDLVHAHLAVLLQLLNQLHETTRPPHPAAGRHLATAHLRLWQATAATHDAFHLLPPAHEEIPEAGCHPERLPEGPPVLTICQRHLSCGHTLRRTTTPTDLNTPLHGHTTTCSH